MNYETMDNIPGGFVPIKSWTNGVLFEPGARLQASNLAKMPFIFKHVAIMPDVHAGNGSTVGSVIPTKGAIIPAAVGVDLGCGMVACRTTLRAEQLPDNLSHVRSALEKAVPHGRTNHGGKGDRGAWGNAPARVGNAFKDKLEPGFKNILQKYKKLESGTVITQLGTLGGGNHFIELCLDQNQDVWIMLHSGSRGIGNKIGSRFIEIAKQDMLKLDCRLPDRELAYLSEGTEHFDDYVEAVDWAQEYARLNRELMMKACIDALQGCDLPRFKLAEEAVNCHHNYISKENHFGENVYITRKGAVSAQLGQLGIIPGSMGAKSFIVRGKGNPDSFCSCSHGAGRVMSRSQAKKTFTLEDHRLATEGVECRKDKDVIDETPKAYKDIDAVMEAQKDLVEVVYTLKQVVCVKG